MPRAVGQIQHEVVAIMHVRTLAVVGLFGLLTACAGRPLGEQFERHPAYVLPQGAMQVFYARVDRLKGNPLAVWAYERGANLDLGPSLEGTSQTLHLAGPIARAVLGTFSGRGEEGPSAVIVATGRFDEEAFRKALDSGQIPYVESQYGQRRFFTCGRGDRRCYVSFPSKQLVVAASKEDLLKRTLDLTRRGARSVAADQGLEPLFDSYAPDLDLWAIGFFPATLSGFLGPQLQGTVQMIRGFTIKVKGDDTEQLNLMLHCAAPEAAEANAAILQNVVRSVVQQVVDMGYRIPALVSVVNQSEIVAKGLAVDLKMVLSKADAAAIANGLRAEPVPPTVETLPPGMDTLPPAVLRPAPPRSPAPPAP